MCAYSQSCVERGRHRLSHGSLRSGVPATGNGTTAYESHQFTIERGTGLSFTLTHVAIQINVPRHVRATLLQAKYCVSPAQG